jgi:DNA-binding FrmR family transcriptional regulator
MSHTTQEKEKRKLLMRLRRIRGQLDAVERRIEEESSCAAILQQATACRGALDGFIAEVIISWSIWSIRRPSRATPARKLRKSWLRSSILI